MAMSNAELEVALKASLQRLVTALANKVAPDSLLLEGKSLAEITSLILAGKAATAGTADNALALDGKDLTTLESERNAQLVAAIDALRTELEGSIDGVTAESIGLGLVENYGVATDEEALAGAVDKYVTAALAVKIAQAKIDSVVDAAPETLNTLKEIAAALHDDPDIVNTLMSNIGANATAIEALEGAVAAFEAKVLGFFDVEGNANNANLFAGKTLDEVLALARDGVDMSNVVLKTDDFGAYKLALTGEEEGVSLKERFEGLATDAAAVDGRLDAAEADLATKATSQALTDAVTALEGAIATLDSETDAALAQAVSDLQAEIAASGSASDDKIAAVQAALDAFVAGKASGEEAIEGTDDSKYITALALKAALDALDLSGKLDVGAQAADSAKLEGKTLAEVIADAQDGVDMSNLVFKTDDLGQYKVALASDGTVTVNKPLWTITHNNPVLSYVITFDGENYVFQKRVYSGAASSLQPASQLTAEEISEGVKAIEIYWGGTPPSGQVFDGNLFYQEVQEPAPAGSLKDAIESKANQAALVAVESDLRGQITQVFNDLDAWKLYTDGFLDETRVTIDGQEVPFLQVISDLKAGIESAGTDSDEAVAAVQAKLDAFIAAKASLEEAAAGIVDDKYMTPAAAKAAFDARWAEKVGAAPETMDTIEEIAAALRNTPDALDAMEKVAKDYTDAEVLAAIKQISGENMEAGTTLASLYAQVVALQDTKLDKTATAVNSEKLGGKSLMDVIDAAVQPGRLFYPVVHVNGNLEDENYVMPSPADVWAQTKTNSVMEQVDTIYAIGVKRLLPGNLLALSNQEGMTLRGAVSEAQEGPEYVVMRAAVDATEWEVITDPLLGCLARLSKHCTVVGDNVERFVPGQTLFYNGFEALSDNVYYDWSILADKEWEVGVFTGSELVIDSSRFHRSEIRIQSTGPVTVTFNVEVDLPYELEMRFVNQTGVEVVFSGTNVVSVPRMEQYSMSKVNGVVRAVRYTNTAVQVMGDLDEAFFENPDYAPAE